MKRYRFITRPDTGARVLEQLEEATFIISRGIFCTSGVGSHSYILISSLCPIRSTVPGANEEGFAPGLVLMVTLKGY